MNRKLLQILKSIIKLFPDNHIDIRVSNVYYSSNKSIISRYDLYISDYTFSSSSLAWSADFEGYNSFITYLNSEFGNTKSWKVIKTIN